MLVAPPLDADVFSKVITKFARAINAFNAQQTDVIKELSSPNAVLYKVSSGEPYRDAEGIQKYLEEYNKDGNKRSFTPLTVALHPPILPTSVRGLALWSRENEDTITVRYEFHFDRADDYKVTLMWAAPAVSVG